MCCLLPQKTNLPKFTSFTAQATMISFILKGETPINKLPSFTGGRSKIYPSPGISELGFLINKTTTSFCSNVSGGKDGRWGQESSTSLALFHRRKL
eukprot:m.87350 g.87350  ORF g.87350 m.87350 type:complete len:96 (+) comp21394_c0_seq1:742-1029(+)